MSPPPNAARGEAALMIDGQPRRLCLTLGALASLEAAFGAEDLSGLARRLARLTANDLLTVLSALLAGGGEQISPEALARARLDPKAAAAAVAEAFRLALDDGR